MSSAGYSGTPLLKKLGVKDGIAGLLVNVPDEITPLTDFNGWSKIKKVKTRRGINGGPFDYIHLFSADKIHLAGAIPALKRQLAQTGMIWISWPKKASGVASTITEDTVRRTALAVGLVDIKVCAIDDVWSGLKLVIPVKDRL